MKPAPFEYHAPASTEHALEVLDALPGAVPLAGGQSLIPLLNLRLARPAHLIDLAGLANLSGIGAAPGRLSIGSMTTHHEVERSTAVRERLPMLSHAVGLIGFPAIRRRGTIGGTIAHADPAAELPLVALALDAEIEPGGHRGSRVIEAADFFLGPFTTARQPGELIVSITFPTPPDAWGFAEFSRRTGDFAVVAAAVAATMRGETIHQARIAVAGVGDRPVRIPAAEDELIGSRYDLATAQRAAAIAAEIVEPVGDIHGSPGFRRRLVKEMLGQALADMGRRLDEH